MSKKLFEVGGVIVKINVINAYTYMTLMRPETHNEDGSVTSAASFDVALSQEDKDALVLALVDR